MELIYKEDAIKTLMDLAPTQHTPDGTHPYDATIHEIQEFCIDAGEALNNLPVVPSISIAWIRDYIERLNGETSSASKLKANHIKEMMETYWGEVTMPWGDDTE